MSARRSSFRATAIMTAAAVITTLAAASSPVLAQARAFKSTPAPAITRVTNPIDDARRLFEEGRWKEARSAYERATRDARVQGEYGREAFEGFANLQYAFDDVKGAARTFDELGERASAFGDPETELVAFFKSALLFQEAGDRVSAGTRVPRIKTLLKSPVISEATRKMVEERIAK
jgi:hypothetical protein